MNDAFQIVAAILFFCLVFALILAYLNGRFSHRHEFRIVDQQTIKRPTMNFTEIDVPIYRKVIIQQCACGKMKKHTIDIC